MAKKSKKKRKNNKMPPLYWLDKLIYWALIAAPAAICVLLVIFPVFHAKGISFRNDDVIAFNKSASVLWFFPTFFLFFIIILLIGSAYTNRYPIFGIPKFRYGPSQYPRIYPLFSKDKPKKKTTPKQKKNLFFLWSIIIAIILSIFATYPLSFYGRDCLNQNGSITVYNAFNTKTKEYASGDIAAVKIYISKNRSGSHRSASRHFNSHYRITLLFTTDSGKSYSYQTNDFRFDDTTQCLKQMLQIKSRFSPDIITYDTKYMDAFFANHNLSEEDCTLIYQLFNMER